MRRSGRGAQYAEAEGPGTIDRADPDLGGLARNAPDPKPHAFARRWQNVLFEFLANPKSQDRPHRRVIDARRIAKFDESARRKTHQAAKAQPRLLRQRKEAVLFAPNVARGLQGNGFASSVRRRQFSAPLWRKRANYMSRRRFQRRKTNALR
jgi:hypothetical protein